MYQTFLKPLFADLKTFILDTLFPISCLSCGQEGVLFCQNCAGQIKILEHQQCIVCQRPSVFGLTHPKCQSPQTADQLICIFDYHDKNLANAIIKGKYYFISDIYFILGQMTSRELKQLLPNAALKNFFLVPIPLNKWRQRWRGFNQAELLCQTIGQILNFPIIKALTRVRATKTQKDIAKREQRIKNISNAFALDMNVKTDIQNKNILLVDDVTTTGATLLEAAKVLKRSGAAKVTCLAVARD